MSTLREAVFATVTAWDELDDEQLDGLVVDLFKSAQDATPDDFIRAIHPLIAVAIAWRSEDPERWAGIIRQVNEGIQP